MSTNHQARIPTPAWRRIGAVLLTIAVALTAFAFLVGLVFLPFGEETKGKPLPA